MRTFRTIRGLRGRRAAFWAGPLLAWAAIAGLADAGTPIRLIAPAAKDPPRLELGRLASPYDADQALRAAGIARTALDRHLQGQTATAAVGFLCGLQPSAQTSGGAGALGVDREGRFLGAQLRFGFR